MKENFVCPNCKKSFLDRRSNTVKLKGVLHGNGFEVSTIFKFSSKKGEYGAKVKDKNLFYEKNAFVTFFCPKCDFDLTFEHDHELAELNYISEEGEELSFIINKYAGKEMSFVVNKYKKEILEAYGEHKDGYMKIFYQILNEKY